MKLFVLKVSVNFDTFFSSDLSCRLNHMGFCYTYRFFLLWFFSLFHNSIFNSFADEFYILIWYLVQLLLTSFRPLHFSFTFISIETIVYCHYNTIGHLLNLFYCYSDQTCKSNIIFFIFVENIPFMHNMIVEYFLVSSSANQWLSDLWHWIIIVELIGLSSYSETILFIIYLQISGILYYLHSF